MRLLRDSLNEITGKQVLVRCNFDVPIEKSQVLDETRIEGAGQTLRVLLEHGCKLVLLAHYDRPKGKEEDKSLRPVVQVLEEMLGETVAFAEEIDKDMINEVPARVVLVENLRFWPGETENDEDLASRLAGLGDYYVNEAFANCHRKHASIVRLPVKLPGSAGFLLEREIKVLSKVRSKPNPPLVVVIGGAKLETKEPLVKEYMNRADTILVGGKVASDLRQKSSNLPDKVVIAESLPDLKDITLESAKKFAKVILAAKTVVWNGTMGVFEEKEYRKGTKIVAEAIDQTRAFTVVGGGDTETALTILDLEHNIDHISSGGGAMLEFLAEGNLPGIEVLGYG